MARYKRYRRYASRAGGKFGGIIPPILGGLADSIINPVSPINGVGSAAVGTFMNSRTVRDLGLYQVGASLAAMLPFGFGGNGGDKGGYF